MHRKLIELLRCPRCRRRLRLDAEAWDVSGERVERGSLQCPGCGSIYPVRGGIARFVPDEGYVASFGRQWTRYAVESPQEDARTFETKTGFGLAELAGKTVLDAGCGGGRYSLVAAKAGANVVAVDMSRAVDRAAELCRGLPNLDFVQADLLRLPLAVASVDLAFSIGVLHHSSRPRRAFDQLAAAVRPGGRLAVWLYRRNTWPQECLNQVLRGITRRMPAAQLESLALAAATLGAIPLLNRLLNKLVNFSNHPAWLNRVCDNFDWYSPQFQSHHTVAELAEWFRAAGFDELTELPPAKTGRLYRWAYEHNLIIGSGVNMVGTKGLPAR